MNVERSIVIAAPADVVWTHAAEGFDRIGDWSSTVASSRAIAVTTGPSLLDSRADLAGRACATGQGEAHETFIALDADARTFTYRVEGGPMPSFVADATNTWRIDALDEQRTRLTMSVRMEVRGIVGCERAGAREASSVVGLAGEGHWSSVALRDLA